MEAIKRRSEVSIRDQVCPLGLCVIISCFDVSLVSHCWIAITRLLINRFGVGNSMVGNMMIRVVIGMPSIIGIMKGANKFSFMCGFKGFAAFVVWCPLV